MDPLERAKAKQRDIADRTTISIPLAMLQDLIKEVEELREALDPPSIGDMLSAVTKMKEAIDEAPNVHGRPGLRPVGGHEGRRATAREGQHGPDDAA